MPAVLTRRDVLKGAAGAVALSTTNLVRSIDAASAAPIDHPDIAPFDHVVVVMMENRSFDHYLGWLPGANGHQAGLTYADTTGATFPTWNLGNNFQGCQFADPNHGVVGGQTQRNGGRNDGFLKTQPVGDHFPIGYYTPPSIPVTAALARNYTALDNYFCSILGPTYPNRFYMHAGRTDRTTNTFTQSTLPTIWDKLAAAGLSGRYYYTDLPVIALFGATRYTSITKKVDDFIADCRGPPADVSFVDPKFVLSDDGTSGDDHPLADIRVGQFFLGARSTRRSAAAPTGSAPSSSSTTTSGAGSSTTCRRPTPRRTTPPTRTADRRPTSGR